VHAGGDDRSPLAGLSGSKMAAVRHLGFVMRMFRPSTKGINFGGLYDCTKFG